MLLFAPALNFNFSMPNFSAYKGLFAVIGVLGVVIFVSVFALAFFYYWIVSFPVRVTIFSVRGGSVIQVSHDRMKKIIRSKSEAYVFRDPKKKGIAIAPPKTRYMFINKKGKLELFLREDSAGNFQPIDRLDLEENKFTVEEKDTRFWFVLNQRLALEAYKDKKWLEKYGNYALFIICMIICFLMIIIVLQKIDVVAAALNSAGARFSSGATNVVS